MLSVTATLRPSTSATVASARRAASAVAHRQQTPLAGGYPRETPVQSIERIIRYRKEKPMGVVIKKYIPGLRLNKWTTWERVRLAGALMRFDRFTMEEMHAARMAAEVDTHDAHHLYIRALQNGFEFPGDALFSPSRGLSAMDTISNACETFALHVANDKSPEAIRCLQVLNMVAKHPFPRRAELIEIVNDAIKGARQDVKHISTHPEREGHLAPVYLAIYRAESHTCAMAEVIQQNVQPKDARRVLDVLCNIWHSDFPTLPPTEFRRFLNYLVEQKAAPEEQAAAVMAYLRFSAKAWEDTKSPLHLEKREFGKRILATLDGHPSLAHLPNYIKLVQKFYAVTPEQLRQAPPLSKAGLLEKRKPGSKKKRADRLKARLAYKARAMANAAEAAATKTPAVPQSKVNVKADAKPESASTSDQPHPRTH
ncbi:hypothetical protein BKA62DRAFT_796982 [Auriculariales sp. MPI-PUGE-AT-0066]|nr:hypothetical protein BKA62DRAFT_796982 [Auriculariales sp. MPI-PUGE-AT-0066]